MDNKNRITFFKNALSWILSDLTYLCCLTLKPAVCYRQKQILQPSQAAG